MNIFLLLSPLLTLSLSFCLSLFSIAHGWRLLSSFGHSVEKIGSAETNNWRKTFDELRPFRIESREVLKTIPITDPVLSKISGFYGLIGPDVNASKVSTLYELFTGDGLIQGVFFNGDNITFAKHFVRTEKLIFESIHGRFSKNIMMTPIYVLLNKMGWLPNVLGLANTALLDLQQKTDTGRHIYALFERDSPYQIHVDFENPGISTVKKRNIPGIAHFSGHSKYKEGQVHTVDYDVMTNQLYYFRLNDARKNRDVSKSVINTRYIPIIHDFAVVNGKAVFVDAPFVWDFTKTMKKIPVIFDHTNPAYICLYDSSTKTTRRIRCPDPFYIFHYADVLEKDGNLEIYAPLYDRLDFSSLDISGKYRRVRVWPSGQVVIKKNSALERLNLDFPRKWGSYVVLRAIEERAITGFVVCKGLDIIRRIRLPTGRHFCGEPAVVEIEGEPFIVGFAYDGDSLGYLVVLGIFTEKYIEQSLGVPLTIGFHSIFLYDEF